MMPGAAASCVAAGKLGMYLPGKSFMMSPNGAFGAILSTVNPELARTLKLETGRARQRRHRRRRRRPRRDCAPAT